MFLLRRSCQTPCKDYLSKSITRWKSQIVSSKFIHTNLSPKIEANNEQGTRILLHHGCHKLEGPFSSKKEKEIYSLRYDNSGRDLYRKLDFSPIERTVQKSNHRFRVAGVRNGVICLADDFFVKMFNYILWNPHVRKMVRLPWPSVIYDTHGPFDDTVGFGFDTLTNDYKVVRLVTLEPNHYIPLQPTLAEVYSLATGSWRSLGDIASRCEVSEPAPNVFLNGAIHWDVPRHDDNTRIILTFDVGSENFGEIKMPENFWCDGLRIVRSRVSVTGDGKSLALFSTCKEPYKDNYFFDIWVMKEYGVRESWTRVTRLGPQSWKPYATGFSKSGEVFLGSEEGGYDRRHELGLLDLASGRINEVYSSPNKICHSIDPYEESLALLDVDNAISY